MNDTSRTLRYELGVLCERYNAIVADKDALDVRLGSPEPYAQTKHGVDPERVYESESRNLSSELRELISQMLGIAGKICTIEGFPTRGRTGASFPQRMLFGALAGAAGTAVLNAATYADMAIRGRPPSDLPKNMVSAFARRMGVCELADPPDETQKHRRSGIAELLGYADGIGTGVLLGAMRKRRTTSPFVTGIVLAIATMLWSEGTATAMRQTDPRTWSASDWIADIVPRCFYGWVTCIAYDALAPQ